MKRVKVMSKEALATMFGGTDEPALEPEATEVEGEELEVVVDTELKAEELEAEDVTAEGEQPSDLDVLQAEFDAFKASAEAEATATEEVLAEWPGKLDAVETAASELKSIVTGQVSKMRLALKMPAVDMTDWKMEAVVAEYLSTQEPFMKHLPVGSLIPEENEEVKEENPIFSSLDSSNYKALGF